MWIELVWTYSYFFGTTSCSTAISGAAGMPHLDSSSLVVEAAMFFNKRWRRTTFALTGSSLSEHVVVDTGKEGWDGCFCILILWQISCSCQTGRTGSSFITSVAYFEILSSISCPLPLLLSWALLFISGMLWVLWLVRGLVPSFPLSQVLMTSWWVASVACFEL